MQDKIQPIEVVEYNRDVDKKRRHPISRHSLVDIIGKVSIDGSLEKLPHSFCRKDFKTGLQKQFECRACKILIESTQALLEHVAGGKHLKAIQLPWAKAEVVNSSVKNREVNIHLTLAEKIGKIAAPIPGLKFVQEFVSVANPSSYRMYRCRLVGCNDEWGTSHEFSSHLISRQHYESFLVEAGNCNKEQLVSLTRDEMIPKVTALTNMDVNDIETIHDEELWEQEKRKLGNRRIGRPARRDRSRKPENGSSVNVIESAEKRKSTADDLEKEQEVKRVRVDDTFDETFYFFENGLRKVAPYYFAFTTHVKGRWVGRKLFDVFQKEFRSQPLEAYLRGIETGEITINGNKVSADYVLGHNEKMSNIVHRHEVPVTADPIEVIHVDDDVVVVDKPASIPVHPCGRYRHNTIIFILGKDHGLKNLNTVHRLDRLTSGILIFCRNAKKARMMEQQIRTHQVQKEYVCRVEGEFPTGPVICSEPIEVVSYKIGVCCVNAETGKPSATEFERLSYNGKTSVVLCKPKSGRMHQIRVHLQYLGYPIINDPLYNHEVFGPEKGRNGNIGKSTEQLIKDLIHIHNAENWIGNEDDVTEDLDDDIGKEKDKQGEEEPKEEIKSAVIDDTKPDAEGDVGVTEVTTPCGRTYVRDPRCSECQRKYRDPRPQDLVMFLHAVSYAGPDWKYTTKLPVWAHEDWVDPSDSD